MTNVYRQVREFFDALIAVPSRGLRFVDFLDLSDWDDGPAFVECYVDQFDIGQFGLAVRDDALIERLEALARARGKLFIVTLGSSGSLALGGATRVTCSAEPVSRVVDTTGAGDAFAAGFLASYSHTKDVAASLRRGSRRAAQIVQQMGAF